jgi:hypothetical protein
MNFNDFELKSFYQLVSTLVLLMILSTNKSDCLDEKTATNKQTRLVLNGLITNSDPLKT